MSKRDYKITPTEFSFGTSLHVEVWDDYGNYCGVYERNREDAWKFITGLNQKKIKNLKNYQVKRYKIVLNQIKKQEY